MAGKGGKTDAEKLVEGDIAKMDLYGLLEVEQEATEKAIVKAYRKMALKHHPDKNPDDPRAAEMFHKLSSALQILTDAAARSAYDKIVKAKKAYEERHQFLDSKRKKFKEELEQREKNIQQGKQDVTPDITQAQKLKKEIDRLRKEGSRMLEEEQERLKEQIKAERASQTKGEMDPPRLKIRWQASKGDPKNGGYGQSVLEKLFNKYGTVSTLFVSKKKVGTAIVEFSQAAPAVLAFENERGLVDNPLSLSWLSGKPEESAHDFSVPDKHQVPCFNPDVLSGFSFKTQEDSKGKHVDEEKDTIRAEFKNPAQSDFESTKPPTSKWDDTPEQHNVPAATTDDFESLVLRNLRQAQERKRLEKQLREED